MEGDGETGQLTVGRNTDHAESQRKAEENTASADKENEQENGERGEKKYHVTNTCLGDTGDGGKENGDQAKSQKRRNHNWVDTETTIRTDEQRLGLVYLEK